MVMVRILKWTTGFLLVLLILMGGAVYALTTEKVQRWLYAKSLEMLAETLQTKVSAKSVAVDFKNGGVALYGVSIHDKRDTTMLRIDTLQTGIDLLPLLQKDVNIRFFNLYGVHAKLYRDQPKSPLNMQFLIDALKNKSPQAQREIKKKGKLNLNVNLTHLDIHRTDFHYDVLSMSRLPKGKFDPAHIAVKDFSVYIKGNLLAEKTITAELKHLQCREQHSGITLSIDGTLYRTIMNRNVIASMKNMQIAYQGTRMELAGITLHQQRGNFDFSQPADIAIKGMHLVTDNGKPRKNHDKPKRGFFDAGHLDVTLNTEATLHYAFRDSISVRINGLNATDQGSGLIVKNLSCNIEKKSTNINVTSLKIRLPKTSLKINTANITLHKKTEDKPASFTLLPCRIEGKVCLQDIAKPFAPVLSNFTTPLHLRTIVSGNIDRIAFENIYVYTDNSKLRITASGDLCNMAKKKQLCLHFNNIQLSAHSGIKEQIVGHFRKKVNLKMEAQMRKLGDIHFSGSVGVFYKLVTIKGTVNTNFGDINLGFGINGNDKMLTGNLNTTDFEVGKVMGISGLGPVTMNVDYSISTSKKNHIKQGGKLPIGWLKAKILNTKYKMLSFKNISAEGQSNGHTATGTLLVRQGVADVIVDFSYTQTADGISYKYKPRIKRHQDTDEEKLEKAVAKAEREAQKKAEKAVAKAENEARAKAKKEGRAAAKELKKAERAEKKAEKAALRAEKEAQKKAEKLAKRDLQ